MYITYSIVGLTILSNVNHTDDIIIEEIYYKYLPNLQ